MSFFKKNILTFILIVFCFFIYGCKKQNISEEDIRVYGMDEVFNYADSRYEFIETKILSRIGKKEPSKGAVFILVKYKEANLSNETKPVGLYKYKLVDSKGKKYKTSSKARWAQGFSEYKNLLASQIHPDIELEQGIIFEVPENSGDFHLEITRFFQVPVRVKLDI